MLLRPHPQQRVFCLSDGSTAAIALTYPRDKARCAAMAPAAGSLKGACSVQGGGGGGQGKLQQPLQPRQPDARR